MLRRNISLILVVLAAFFFLWGFASSLRHRSKKGETKLSTVGIHAMVKRPFVLFIPKNPNKHLIESVNDQSYSQYRTVFFNPDVLEELHSAIQSCKNEEILLFLEEGDWLAHEDVLKWINLCYEDPSVWMTYGNFVEYPSYKKGSSKTELPFCPLQSGYAGLFKKVEKEDLSARLGVKAAAQMAKGHIRQISDVLVVCQKRSVEKEEWEKLKSLDQYGPIVSWREEL